MIAIVDYGMGNLFSLKNAFKYVSTQDISITQDPHTIKNAQKVVLAGVGAFGAGMSNLDKCGLTSVVRTYIERGGFVLGICLGMQMMMEASEEFGNHDGIGSIKGRVVKFPESFREKIPHIGWNTISSNENGNCWHDSIFAGINNGEYMYFVHSYFVEPKDASAQLAVTNYGGHQFCSAIQNNNIYGCQFHPEKSGEAGLAVLRNFCELT